MRRLVRGFPEGDCQAIEQGEKKIKEKNNRRIFYLSGPTHMVSSLNDNSDLGFFVSPLNISPRDYFIEIKIFQRKIFK